MNAKLLIDAIVRQTTVLIAQLSTAAGIRAPLAHLADQVFLDLARELEVQGLGRKVAADMFGMAVRGYQKKVQRLEESATVREQTLWEALLEYIQKRDGVHRREIIERFRRDGEEAVASVLRDLTASGLVYVTGSGPNSAYRPTSERDLQQLLDAESADSLSALAWVTVYHHPGITVKELAVHLNTAEDVVAGAVRALRDEGRLETVGTSEPERLRARSLVLPVGSEMGWEAALLDHFQAMATAIGAKLRSGTHKSQRADVIGGTTMHFDLRRGHPLEGEVYGLLQRVRAEVNDLWQRVCEHNEAQPIADDEIERVCFYFGQNVIESDRTTELE
jgi:hypothetical protein